MVDDNVSVEPDVAAPEDRSKGFTLIELMVVIIVIGILAAIAIPAFLLQRQSAWDSSAKADLANFRIAATQYEEAQNGAFTGMTLATVTAAPYGFKPSGDQPSAQWTVTVPAAGTSYSVQVFSKNYPSPGTGHIFTFNSSTGLTTQS